MMKETLLLAVSLGCLLYAAPMEASVLSAELTVNGISCPFCAFGIEKKLLDVDGVDGVEVSLDDGRIAVTFAAGNSATVGDLVEAVDNAGFKLAALTLSVDGRLLHEGKSGARLVSGGRMTLRLVEKGGEGTGPISDATLERLRGAMAPGDGSVVVAGAISDWDESEPTLVLESVEARKP
jgi:mercuric ion binding protein